MPRDAHGEEKKADAQPLRLERSQRADSSGSASSSFVASRSTGGRNGHSPAPTRNEAASTRVVDFDSAYYSFLTPAKRRDAKQRRPDHPQFDASSVHISDRDAQDFTPVEWQYWDFKKTKMDHIVAFKVGTETETRVQLEPATEAAARTDPR